MIRKSFSTSGLPSPILPSQQPESPSIVYDRIRLNFPKPGDSSIFANVGRRHFSNSDNRLLKIILPHKYALENPIMRREQSLPPPHLQRHYSERSEKESASTGKSSDRKDREEIRERVQDELEKMQRVIELRKGEGKTAEPARNSEVKSTQVRVIEKLSVIPPLPLPTSPKAVFTPVSPAQPPSLLYNPQNKQKYDEIALSRSQNPTHLSTGLSII